MGDIFDDVEKLIAEEALAKASKTSEPAVDSSPIMDEIPTMESTPVDELVSEEQIFNDSELEDIMAEIESLESDFESATPEDNKDIGDLTHEEVSMLDGATPEPEELKLDSSTVSKTDLQKEIEREIAMIDSSLITSNEETFAETVAKVVEAPMVEPAVTPMVSVKEEIPDLDSSVLSFDKKPAPVVTPTPAPVPTMKEEPVRPAFNNAKSEMSFQASGSMSLNLVFKIGNEEAKLFVDETKGLVINMSGVEICLNDEHGCSVLMENGINFNIPLTSKDASSKKKSA